MEKILRFLEKLIPKKLYEALQPYYHYTLALVGAIFNGFPARKLYIIGVTGTKGKSTVTEIVNTILEENGYKTAVSNTIRFKIGDESRQNHHQMSTPGRFFMQNFLSKAAKTGCTHAVVEITSEGSKQFRNKFVWLDAFIFTNLAPEHIESHGSFDKYREAKLRIVDSLKKNGIVVANQDDDEAEMFLNRRKDAKKITYSISDAKPIGKSGDQTKMMFNDVSLYTKLVGNFNVYNILAAATLADELGIGHEIIRKAVENLDEIPGRVQKVDLGQDFEVVIDYAHTPESLEQLYEAFENKKKVCVLGNTGGVRDKWKRPVMARIAEKYCDHIILTNEDPYDEDPEKIVTEMLEAIKNKPAEIILDRRQAIATAIERAGKGGSVLISGKGTEAYIVGPNRSHTPWSDYNVAKEELQKFLNK